MRHLAWAALLLGSALSLAQAGEMLQPGDYLEDQTLSVLRATRSPNQAIGDGLKREIPQAIQVRQTDAGLTFEANWNWHEWEVVFVRHADGKLFAADCGGEGCGFSLPAGAEPDRPDHFHAVYRGRPIGYTRVGNSDRTIVTSALVGSYTDAKGGKVVFGADGTLRGAALAGQFLLQNDHVFDRFDFFLLGPKETQRVIAFRWIDGVLSLFPVTPFVEDRPGWGEPDYHHPIAVLRPTAER